MRSVQCLDDGHDRCPHFSGLDVGSALRRRAEDHVYVLCLCSCHDGCPLAGRGAVPRGVWALQCTCPGADPVRARQEQADRRRRDVAEVMEGVQREGLLAADEIETRLRAAYLRHGEDLPPGLRGWAKVAAAGTARPGTRTPRLVWLGVRAVARSVAWAWEPVGGATVDDRKEARTLYRAAAGLSLTSALLTGAAARASGSRRAGAGVLAALGWLATLATTALGTLVVQLVRTAGARTDVPTAS